VSVDERVLYAGTVAVLLVGTTLALALGAAGASDVARPNQPATGEADFEVTDDGTRYTTHPSQLRHGCPGGMDCIPSIDDPTYQSADAAGWLADEDLVIGIDIDGEARACPLRILNVHEIVNDEVGGVPVLVLGDQQDGGVKLFVREVDGERVRFTIEDGQIVDEAENRWRFDGTAVEGPHQGRQLERLNSHGVFWFAWSEFHPETDVYQNATGQPS